MNNCILILIKIFYLVITINFVVASSNSDDDTPTQTSQNKYDEAIDGDLFNDNTIPTTIAFSTGNNKVTSSQSASDVDYISFTVFVGDVLSAIVVGGYI